VGERVRHLALRHRAERRTGAGAAPDPPQAAPLDRLEPLDLERAIAGLPDGYRTVLVLHDVEGYTHEEIGAALGIAPGTSKSQLFWARQAVRAALGSRQKGSPA
jgi:RNA polymerase sigma-70 factor (ECF subfamily)